MIFAVEPVPPPCCIRRPQRIRSDVQLLEQVAVGGALLYVTSQGPRATHAPWRCLMFDAIQTRSAIAPFAVHVIDDTVSECRSFRDSLPNHASKIWAMHFERAPSDLGNAASRRTPRPATGGTHDGGCATRGEYRTNFGRNRQMNRCARVSNSTPRSVDIGYWS